ncbi:MAG: phytoene desaturase family protein, partial [Fluviicola sp.]
MKRTKKIIVIGSGISSLTCAAHLAKAGHQVTILEKNETIGGRARKFTTDSGFIFDMGPSWYWMPEVFEKFYNEFGYTASDFYELVRLDPSYQIIWEDGQSDGIPAKKEELKAWFEKNEVGSGEKLDAFLKDAAYKYDTGMNDLVQKPSLSILEFAQKKVIFGVFKLHLFSSFSKFIRKYFQNPKLLKVLEFPILFLGATPENTPALYSLMNYADLELGTWYPMKGMHEFILAFERIAREQGVEFKFNTAVQKIISEENKVTAVETSNGTFEADFVVSGADYKHTEDLLKDKANYSEKYWDTRTMAPSSLLYYVGVDKVLPKLHHHNLFFDKPFEQHAKEIYETPQWPSDPLFYLCCPSKTDATVAPEGKENL